MKQNCQWKEIVLVIPIPNEFGAESWAKTVCAKHCACVELKLTAINEKTIERKKHIELQLTVCSYYAVSSLHAPTKVHFAHGVCVYVFFCGAAICQSVVTK